MKKSNIIKGMIIGGGTLMGIGAGAAAKAAIDHRRESKYVSYDDESPETDETEDSEEEE